MESVRNGISREALSLDDDYEPYSQRKVKHPTTYFETFIHMLKASLGTGLLAMPKAFEYSGWLVGLIGTLVIGIICTYAVHMLIACEYELCKRRKVPVMTYHATAQAAVEEGPRRLRRLAPYVPCLTKILFLISQIGVGCIYVLFISSNIKAVVDQYQAPSQQIDAKWYMLMILLPLMMINSIKNLKYLAPFSTLGNVGTIISYGIIFYYMFTDLPSLSTVNWFGSWEGIALYFGAVLFSLESIGLIMPLENEMKNPKEFITPFGVLNVAMVPNEIMFMTVGFFGYLKYGSKVDATVTLSLPNEDVLAQSSRLLLAFSITITHALATYMAFDILKSQFIDFKVVKHKTLAEFCLRMGLVILTVALAASIPYLDLVISLVGALSIASLGLLFPPIIELFTYWYEVNGTRFFFWFIKNLFVILVGGCGLVIGSYTAILSIIEQLFP